MSDIAIHVEHLGKRYQIGATPQRYRAIRDTLGDALKWPARMVRRLSSGTSSRDVDAHVWALKDVSFDIRGGEIVGVIGKNGAGKSTLLKVLSRITEPTAGRAQIRGRVGSLLEVGTGFHPELTGRENIFLNGAILGMRKAEIERSFDEIVDFSEVARFIDTPVKHYSSGMYLRLAFAVAAHLETEILLVDEVLAVGDVEFQKKCLGKVGEVSKRGRTVLLVSHQMAAVESLSTRCLWLKDGQLQADGPPADVIGAYMAASSAGFEGTRNLSARVARPNQIASLTEVRLLDPSGAATSQIRMNGPLTVQVDFTARHSIRPVLGVVVKTSLGSPIFSVNNRFIPSTLLDRSTTSGTIRAIFDALPLMPGTYFVDLYLGDEYIDHDVVRDSVSFEVLAADVFGTGKLAPPGTGPIAWPARFELDDVTAPEIALSERVLRR